MALRFASLLLCTLCVGFGVAIPAPPPTGQCGPNSERRTCGTGVGTGCVPTCQNPFPGPLCLLPCVDGCFCVQGYLKSANGSCVRPEQCEHVPRIPMQIPDLQLAVAEPKQCGVNEEFRTCGPMCQPTCHTSKWNMFCSLRCNQGCFCKEGYIRSETGDCVPTSQCPSVSTPIQVLAAELPHEEPKQCGENEEYRTCGPFCQPTCNFHLPMFCSLRCNVGCFCKEGHLRNHEGKCVPKSQCDSSNTPAVGIVPLRRVTLRPGSDPMHRFGIPPVKLPGQSGPDSGPINIPLEKVPDQPHCPHPEEEFHFCGVQLNCLASCKIPMTPKCMERTCTPGCKCREPLVRNEDGRCIMKTECPKTTTPSQ